MNTELPEDNSKSPMTQGREPSHEKHDNEVADDRGRSGGAAAETTVLVRGETIGSQEPKAQPKPSSEDSKDDSSNKKVSKQKVEAQNRLPGLDDDSDIGVPKAHIVTRDDEADLAFTGTLLASAAPAAAPKGQWQEYRVYETDAGKYVFSKITRKILAEEQDTHEAEVFDPSPTSTTSKLLKSAHDLTHTRPVLWSDAAVEFFGYDPLAKLLYRKFGAQFEEHID